MKPCRRRKPSGTTPARPSPSFAPTLGWFASEIPKHCNDCEDCPLFIEEPSSHNSTLFKYFVRFGSNNATHCTFPDNSTAIAIAKAGFQHISESRQCWSPTKTYHFLDFDDVDKKYDDVDGDDVDHDDVDHDDVDHDDVDHDDADHGDDLDHDDVTGNSKNSCN